MIKQCNYLLFLEQIRYRMSNHANIAKFLLIVARIKAGNRFLEHQRDYFPGEECAEADGTLPSLYEARPFELQSIIPQNRIFSIKYFVIQNINTTLA